MDFLITGDQDVIIQTGMCHEHTIKRIACPCKLICDRNHIVERFCTDGQPHTLRYTGNDGVSSGIDPADFMQILQFQSCYG